MTESHSLEVVFLGDSQDIIRGFPAGVKEDFGGDLRRLQEGERPLDSASMAPTLRCFELRTDDKDTWYRLFYHVSDGVIYVLHCFMKKTNKTSQSDIEIGSKRLNALKQHLAKTKKH